VRDHTVYEFGDIRVDLGRMAATRGDAAIPIEPKAFDVLVYLVEHRDHLVSKDELLEAVWPGTFVTPNVLTRAIAQIRKAIGDDADAARYIETAAKRGYRFIAPVVVLPARSGAELNGTVPPVVPAPATKAHSTGRTALVLAAFLIIALGTVAVVLQRPRDPETAASEPHLTRLSNRRGFNGTPALSADGRSLVYSSDATGALELYLASLTPGMAEVPLTRDGGHNMQPAWSPDGQWIAYHSRKRGGIWIVPAAGGVPQQVTESGAEPAWAPDSSTLVFTSDSGGFAGQANLWTVKRDGSGRKALTQIGTPPGGHRSPAWSHDGRLIAFVVSRGALIRGVRIVDVATGAQQPVDRILNASDPEFAPDDRAIVWGGATATGNGRIFRRALDEHGQPIGSTETLLPFDGGIVQSVSIARNGTIGFAAHVPDINLWAVDVDADGRGREPVRLTNDVARSSMPSYSADGRIAYQQLPIGSPSAIWTINEDGTGREAFLPGVEAFEGQWDRAGGRLLIDRREGQGVGMAWVDLASRRIEPVTFKNFGFLYWRLSPDAKAIAFHQIEKDGRMSVWTTTFDGRRTKIAEDPEAVSYPVWSPDGTSLAVELKRGESTQIGVVTASGGPVTVLTDGRGQHWPSSWAPDGDRIAFAGEREGVWNLYTVSRKTRAVTPLTTFTSPAGYVRYPAWSPKGSRVVFERAQETSTVWTATLPQQPPRATTRP
jgi:Tol biopolymer transport system component/DNA-binding winged helix-turn-helix (wHTH) protein